MNGTRRRKYHVPDTIQLDTLVYERWLHRKAVAHVRRDRKRGNDSISVSLYKEAIHDAVQRSGDTDYFTGELLDWNLVSKYDNEQSKKMGRAYKATFELLPTVDHLDDGLGAPNFVICGWRTNSAKSDMTPEQLFDFCQRVVNHQSNYNEK